MGRWFGIPVNFQRSFGMRPVGSWVLSVWTPPPRIPPSYMLEGSVPLFIVTFGAMSHLWHLSPSLILLSRQNEVFPLCSPGTWFILSHSFILSCMIVLFPSMYLQVQGSLISLPLTYCLTHSRLFKIYRSFELEGFLAAELCPVIILQLSSKGYNIQWILKKYLLID